MCHRPWERGPIFSLEEKRVDARTSLHPAQGSLVYAVGLKLRGLRGDLSGCGDLNSGILFCGEANYWGDRLLFWGGGTRGDCTGTGFHKGQVEIGKQLVSHAGSSNRSFSKKIMKKIGILSWGILENAISDGKRLNGQLGVILGAKHRRGG